MRLRFHVDAASATRCHPFWFVGEIIAANVPAIHTQTLPKMVWPRGITDEQQFRLPPKGRNFVARLVRVICRSKNSVEATTRENTAAWKIVVQFEEIFDPAWKKELAGIFPAVIRLRRPPAEASALINSVRANACCGTSKSKSP